MQEEVNQEECEQNEVDGVKKGADSRFYLHVRMCVFVLISLLLVYAYDVHLIH